MVHRMISASRRPIGGSERAAVEHSIRVVSGGVVLLRGHRRSEDDIVRAKLGQAVRRDLCRPGHRARSALHGVEDFREGG
eukprot:scaffold5221_cov122-Isochrysis_galbana.AAC.5